jgi:hypothetical protein
VSDQDIYGATREIAISSEFTGDRDGPGMLHLDGEEGPWCVTLAPVTRSDGALLMTHVRDFRAVIAWGAGGVGGARAEAVVDWPQQGGTFVIQGSDLDLRPALTRVAGGPPDFGVVRFSAFASRATGPRAAKPPTRSMDLGYTAAGVTLGIVVVPSFAKRFRLFSSVNLQAGVIAQITWLTREGVATHNDLWIDSSGAAALTAGVTYDVPQNAQRFVLQNVGAVDSQFFIAFDLDIG